jgi:hypothetical protein
MIEFDLKDTAKIQNWLKDNLINKDIIINDDYWQVVFEKCGFIPKDADLFVPDGNAITFEKVLEEKNEYI